MLDETEIAWLWVIGGCVAGAILIESFWGWIVIVLAYLGGLYHGRADRLIPE